MSNIRRQSIISSLVIYLGFLVGFLNTYFFAKENLFSTVDYGLTNIFIAIATMMMAFANLAMPSYIFKFYPYYKDHLGLKKNDMLTWALFIGTIGFVLVMIAGWFFKDLVVRKYGANSPQLISYYYWIFPMGLGLTIYTILEAYAWNLGKSVLTNFLKEVLWRVLVTVLIVFFIFNWIPNFDVFIKIYAFLYPVIALVLFCYLLFTGKVHFTFNFSKVTRRFAKKIAIFCSFIYASTLVFNISLVFDSIVIASVLPQGIEKVGIFGLATIMSSVIQAPQRAVNATTIPHLARAWKEKNHVLLQKIYQRSSINMLIFSCGLFVLIAINYKEAIYTLKLKEEFLLGFDAFILIGLTRVIDLGTGVNSLIINTSTYWKFELASGVLLLTLMLPLTYVLTKQYDILGPAIAALISMAVYNTIRIIFLWIKFKLFPFTRESLYTVLVAAIGYSACIFLLSNVHGFTGMIARSLLFIAIYASAVLYFKFSPDVQPVVDTILKRIRKK